MSRRVFVLIGAMVIVSCGARAANAPLAVDPRVIDTRSIDPREDLFAPKPRNVAPVASPAVAPPPAAPAVHRVSTGNPLWAIPLARLTAGREHPLFAKTRRPPPVAVVARPVAAPLKAAEPEKPSLALLGTIAGREKIGLFIDSASKAMVRLKAGENHKGWVLRDVRPRRVELARGLDSTVLELAPPDVKAGGTPVLAAAMPGASPPVGPALPGGNAANATGVLPAAPRPGATIIGQPPVFQPPPTQINPFPKGRL
ncbi:MAG: hypothetical protein V4517_10670 [Pseudomonadota bacterium]|jgi:hypothetical protein